MLETIAGILIVMWVLGFATHMMGSFIHILLVLAVITVLLRIIRGRPVI